MEKINKTLYRYGQVKSKQMRQIIAFFFGLIIFVTSCGQVDKKISISQLTGKDTIDKKPNDVYEQVNKENFINSIQKTIIDSSLKQYYLNENCSRFEFDKEDHWFFEKFLDCKTIQELVHKSNKDTLPEKWDCSKILNSKCVNRHFMRSAFAESAAILRGLDQLS